MNNQTTGRARRGIGRLMLIGLLVLLGLVVAAGSTANFGAVANPAQALLTGEWLLNQQVPAASFEDERHLISSG